MAGNSLAKNQNVNTLASARTKNELTTVGELANNQPDHLAGIRLTTTMKRRKKEKGL